MADGPSAKVLSLYHTTDGVPRTPAISSPVAVKRGAARSHTGATVLGPGYRDNITVLRR
jgi:hypothetical protein